MKDWLQGKIDKLGKYSVKVKKNFYNYPLFPTTVRVYDDDDPLHLQANSIRFALLKKNIGKQDHYAAAYGGLNYIRFYNDESVTIRSLSLSNSIRFNFRKGNWWRQTYLPTHKQSFNITFT